MSDPYIPSFGGIDADEERVDVAPGAISATFLGGTGSDNGGNSGGDSGEFDPAIHVSRDKRNADGSYTRKRGRRSGGGSNASSTKKAGNQAGIDALTETLLIVHAGIASLSKIPELELDRDDGERLSKATVRVLDEFDFVPSPKVQAVVGLVSTAGLIYGSKIYMIRERLKAEKADNKEE